MNRAGRVLRRRRDERFINILFILLVVINLLIYIYHSSTMRPGRAELLDRARRALIEKVHPRLRSAGMITVLEDARFDPREGIILAYNYPRQKKHSEISLGVGTILSEYHLEVLQSLSLPQEKRLIIEVGVDGERIGKLYFAPEGRFVFARLGLVIDDFGYFYNDVVRGFMDLPIPLTCSVIPGHEYSTAIARDMVNKGKQVFLHMPMEPEKYRGEERNYVILANMPRSAIINRLTKGFQSVPTAIGLNNHEGSRATASRRIMEVVIQFLKQNDKYFLDSMTSPRSVGYDVAREYKLPTGYRSVFIDNINQEEEILKQLNRLCQIAEKKGFAIAIGHVRPTTLLTLNKYWRKIQEKGYQWVFVSELLQ